MYIYVYVYTHGYVCTYICVNSYKTIYMYIDKFSHMSIHMNSTVNLQSITGPIQRNKTKIQLVQQNLLTIAKQNNSYCVMNFQKQ